MPLYVRAHHRLETWREAIALVEEIYRVTETFPSGEKFGLTAQLRRAAVSVPSNIAEGAARDTTKEFLRFLIIARSSLSELETELEIARLLGYIPSNASVIVRLQRVSRLLDGLVRHLRNARPSRTDSS